uniref:Uncharacterized protein n=1 Tax=Ditylenchus dipsaci TaxID=166011 RepID=A0A915E2X5_9BILA
MRLKNLLNTSRFRGEEPKFVDPVSAYLRTEMQATHSLRAVHISAAQNLRTWDNQQNMAFHIHLEEQRQEVEDCKAAEGGTTPCQLLLKISDDLGQSHSCALHIHSMPTPG